MTGTMAACDEAAQASAKASTLAGGSTFRPSCPPSTVCSATASRAKTRHQFLSPTRFPTFSISATSVTALWR